MAERCDHGPGCEHWDSIVANAGRFAVMVSAAQRQNPLYPDPDMQGERTCLDGNPANQN